MTVPVQAPGVLPAPLVPAYGSTALGDLMPSVLAAAGVAGEDDRLGLAAARRTLVVLVDGMGDQLLRAHPDEAPYLTGLLRGARTLTAGFPATTVTSLGSLGTGRPPGEHGLLGYQVAVPGAGRLLDALHWDKRVDPLTWQPYPTVFQRAAADGMTVTHVGPSAVASSGLTLAALRGPRFAGADTTGERVAETLAALHAAKRALVYSYYGDLDATGHRRGCGSTAWRAQLRQADRFVEQLAAGLPSGTAMYVTADHGMVDIDPGNRIDLDADLALLDGVELLGGESRARHVYARPGAADDVLAAWRERLGDLVWVASRDEAITAGWFGPYVAAELRERIGDVVAAPCADVALVATQREPRESVLVGVHGSLTVAEQLVPLLEVR
jgi:hypothetical protein